MGGECKKIKTLLCLWKKLCDVKNRRRLRHSGDIFRKKQSDKRENRNFAGYSKKYFMKKEWMFVLLSFFLSAMSLSAKVSNEQDGLTKITVASWNIGHFALGKANDTKITAGEEKEKAAAYCNLFNEVNVDLLALVEFNPVFVNAADGYPAVMARDAILSNYRYAEIGEKDSYNCNALFSNGLPLKNAVSVKFAKMVQTRYYLCSEIELGGKTVKVVATHLDWNQGQDGAAFRALQIQELIEAFKDEPYVILCADWNTKTPDEFDAFIKAGYNMANHGYLGDLKTFPAGGNPQSVYDNIIVKGFDVNGVQVRNNKNLSDHCLIQAELTMEK